MFTGLVEMAGAVVALARNAGGVRFTVDAGPVADGVRIGDSIAVNGCCLTVAGVEAERVSFDLLRETQERTNLAALEPGALVNLERSLRADARLGGHFVTGHIDTAARVLRWEPSGPDWVLDVELAPEHAALVVSKGCLAVDGISLTVAEITDGAARMWIIPHTRAVTNLRARRAGERVNLEFDLLAKYVARLLHR
jgi:riboflavin synthase